LLKKKGRLLTKLEGYIRDFDEKKTSANVFEAHVDMAFNQYPKLLARLKRRQGDNSDHSNSAQRSPVATDTTVAVLQEENKAHNTASGRATQDTAEADLADTSSDTSKEGEGSGGGDSDEEVHRTEQPLATSNVNLLDLAQVGPGHARHAQITSDPLSMILEYALMAENSLSLIDFCKESYPLGTLYTCQTFWTLGSATFFSSNVFKLQVGPARTTYSANADKVILVCYDTIVRFKDEYSGCLPLKLAFEDLGVEGKLNPDNDRKFQKVIGFPRAAYFGVDVLQRLRRNADARWDTMWDTLGAYYLATLQNLEIPYAEAPITELDEEVYAAWWNRAKVNSAALKISEGGSFRNVFNNLVTRKIAALERMTAAGKAAQRSMRRRNSRLSPDVIMMEEEIERSIERHHQVLEKLRRL